MAIALEADIPKVERIASACSLVSGSKRIPYHYYTAVVYCSKRPSWLSADNGLVAPFNLQANSAPRAWSHSLINITLQNKILHELKKARMTFPVKNSTESAVVQDYTGIGIVAFSQCLLLLMFSLLKKEILDLFWIPFRSSIRLNKLAMISINSKYE